MYGQIEHKRQHIYITFLLVQRILISYKDESPPQQQKVMKTIRLRTCNEIVQNNAVSKENAIIVVVHKQVYSDKKQKQKKTLRPPSPLLSPLSLIFLLRMPRSYHYTSSSSYGKIKLNKKMTWTHGSFRLFFFHCFSSPPLVP